MLQLHYHPGNASLISHLVLEELGAPFTLKHVDRAQAAHKSAEYLAMNPNGLIPVLVDGRSTGLTDGAPLVLYESAAICMHLADTHRDAALLPELGTPERAQAYKWLSWCASTLQPALIVYFYPDRWADDAAGAAVVKAHAERKVDGLIDQIDAELAHGRPWFLGDRFSVVDPYAFVLCRWTRGFGRPARTLPNVQPWLDRMLARPAVQRAFATEKLERPWV